MVWGWYDIGNGRKYVIIDMFMIWHNVNRYVRNMLCDCYDIRYDMIRACWELLCLKVWKHYDMIYVRHKWYDMFDMQNNELAWNITSVYAWKIWQTIWETIWKTIWYVRNASGVVLNDNTNGKMLGPHASLCAYALGDTPYPSR